MLRVITSSTHRRLQEAVTEAERIPGLETELADLRKKLEIARNERKGAARTAEDLADARKAGAEIAATLTQPDARQREAILDIAASLVRHAQGLGLDVKRLHSGEPYSTSPTAPVEPESQPAGAESEDGTEPYVHVYVHQGQIRSVHRWSEAAVRQAHTDGAPPEGWCQDRSCSEMPGPMPYSLYLLPVQVPWPDRSQVHLVLHRDRPIAAFGTEQAARRDCVITSMAATEPALIRVVSQPIADSQLYPTAAPDEHGLDTKGAHRHHARLLAAMATGRCAAMRRQEVEPPEDFLQLCSNLRAAAVKLSVTEAEIDEYASTWAALL
ncbi:hypothetical protein ABZT06_39155 [Streptomyces sp. NPDC005483]|uniref:hypothetical protein n=1 Tax=Streptomyces sp. NPDC005483 TaxID=3154882 RepID=UPI0033BA2683